MGIGSPCTAEAAWLALGFVPGLGPRGALDLIARCGSPVRWLGASPAALAAMGVPAAVAEGFVAARERAEAERAAIAAAGATLVTWDAPGYPERLHHIADPPLWLAVRGGLTEADTLAVAVVGARRASERRKRARRAPKERQQALAHRPLAPAPHRDVDLTPECGVRPGDDLGPREPRCREQRW